jgi:uncharacterized membrane protein (DUF2068 family)
VNSDKPLEQRVGHSLVLVRLIALSKFLKATVLLVVGYLILHLIKIDKTQHQTLHDTLHEFVNNIRLDPDNHYIHLLLEKTIGVSDATMRWLGMGTLIYSGLFYIEGVGLFFDRGWAEWMTVITTTGFIPIEVIEIFRQPTILRVLILTLNVLIVIYIAMRIRWRYQVKMVARAEGVPVKVVKERVEARAVRAVPDAGAQG